MDQVDQGADNGLAPAPGVSTSDQQNAQQMSGDLAAGVTCYTTDCNQQCKKGTNSVAQMNGQPGQLSTCLLYTSPSPRDGLLSRMPSSA